MPETALRPFKRCVEFQPLQEIKNVPPGILGLCVLLRWRPRIKQFDVVYVGMARTGGRRRLNSHATSESKRDLWTHFSVFEVFDNISAEEIQEPEGLLPHIYRRDYRATRLNAQRAYTKLSRVRSKSLDTWWERS